MVRLVKKWRVKANRDLLSDYLMTLFQSKNFIAWDDTEKRYN
jgi:hypothetical protein